jgi:hypothetical protein
VGHTIEVCWKLHPEKRPMRLESMTVDPGQGSLLSELKMMLEESEKKIPEIVKGFLRMLSKRRKLDLEL